jgi:L-ascorbate metabolism protein UlaG (beta-lactamase superfamily)
MAHSTTLHLGPGLDRPGPEHGSILFVGTATTVVQLGPFTLLTDPNFLHAGDHAHLGYGMSSRRLTDPAIEIDALPPLDACVLSHFHGDHWDEVATARLPKELPIVTTHHAAKALERKGFSRTHALGTWDDVKLTKGSAWLRITSMPGRHGPPVVSALLPPVMGSMWELGARDGVARFRLYVSGDTLVHDDLRRIPERYPDVDLGLFHLGGTRVLGLLVTMDAAQGIEAIRIVRPHLAIPIHFDDYPVFKSPLEDFVKAVSAAGLDGKVKYLGRGERHAFTVGETRRAPAGVEARPGAARPGDAASATRDGSPWDVGR